MVTQKEILSESFQKWGRILFRPERVAAFIKIGFILFVVNPSLAQTPSIPVSFDHTWQTFIMSNPSSLNARYKKGYTAGSRLNAGPVNIFQSFYATGEFRIGEKPKGSNLGIVLKNTREGQLFQQSEAQILYAYRIVISSETAMAGGISLGFRNYYIEPTSISPGSSEFMPVGNAGIWLSNDQWQAGVSFNQIPGGGFQPLQEQFRLDRYATIGGEIELQTGYNIKFKPAGLLIIPASERLHFNISGIFEINNLFNAGLAYRYRETISMIAGLNHLALNQQEDKKINFYLSYSFPWGSDYKRLNILELSLRYFVE